MTTPMPLVTASPLSWQWLAIGQVLLIGGASALAWVPAYLAMRRWRQQAQAATARAVAAERAVVRLRGFLTHQRHQRAGETVLLAPALVAEADRVLCGEAATQVLSAVATRRIRRLHGRMAGRRRRL